MTEDIVEAELENALCAPSWDKALEHIHAAQAALAAIRETHAIVPIAEAKELLANADSDPCELGYQRDVATFLSAIIAAAEGEG